MLCIQQTAMFSLAVLALGTQLIIQRCLSYLKWTISVRASLSRSPSSQHWQHCVSRWPSGVGYSPDISLPCVYFQSVCIKISLLADYLQQHLKVHTISNNSCRASGIFEIRASPHHKVELCMGRLVSNCFSGQELYLLADMLELGVAQFKPFL